MTNVFTRKRAMAAALVGFALQILPSTVSAKATTHYPPAADGDGTVSGKFATTRWAEDWTSLADPEKRDDPIDHLKHIAITDDVYIALSGELRLRTNYTSNPGLVKGEHQREDQLRIVGGADLHIGKHLRFYGEMAHASAFGHNIGTPASNHDNDLLLQQAFVEADGEIAGADVGLRYGRQEFVDGSSLLVSQLDNNPIPYTLNGIRGWARWSKVRVDAFDFEPTVYGRKGLGDDDASDTTRFSGVTAGLVVPSELVGGSKLYVDPFFWRLRRNGANWLDFTAREERYYLGSHIWGDLGPAKIDWTVNRQWGSYGDRDISAWQAFLDQSVPTGLGDFLPQAGLVFFYASGGGGKSNGVNDSGPMRNAIAPYGANTPFAHHLFLSATNLVAFAPKIEMRPAKNVRIQAEYEFAWRDSVHDAIYRPNGKAMARTAGSSSAKIGELPRLQLTWNIAPRVNIVARYEHVFAGEGLKQAGYGDSDFLTSWISLRF